MYNSQTPVASYGEVYSVIACHSLWFMVYNDDVKKIMLILDL